MARILVVEDEARIASFVAKGLRLDGHEVVVAEDGGLGLFLAGSDEIDLVVLDIGLPDVSGLEVLTEVVAQRPGLPVVVLTGFDDPQHRTRCLAAGAAAFLAKPFSVAGLRAEIRDLLHAP